jgi:predicted esterase/catechol 2,3-dioxygenase-like lactoylglutathione lyase family enzyme
MAIEIPALPLKYCLRIPRVKMRKPPLLILLPGMGYTNIDLLKRCAGLDERMLILSLVSPHIGASVTYPWYNLERIGSSSFANSVQVEYSRQLVEIFIPEAVKAFKANAEQVYVTGIGQGAVIALALLLTAPQLIDGVAAVSGQVLPEMRAAMANPDHLKDKHILIIHGLKDQVFPVALGRAAVSALTTMKLTVEYKEFDMDHILTPISFNKLSDWLTHQLDQHGVIIVPDPSEVAAQINGVHLKVRELERSISFYNRFLGLRLVERVGRTYAFLSNTDAHFNVALQNVGLDAPQPSEQSVGLYRVQFRVPDQISFARVYKRIVTAGLPVSIIDHLVNWSLHFEDPDGNGLEVFWDTRRLPGKSDLWQGRDLPLEGDTILEVLKHIDPEEEE